MHKVVVICGVIIFVLLNGCATPTITRDGVKYDAIETNPKYKEIIKKAEEEAYKNIVYPEKLGYCHIFWREKKRILKEKYGIDWKSPAELNPQIMFD